MFETTSRYYNLETAIYSAADGRIIPYKRRRFLPQGENVQLLATIAIADGERLDQITARILGDPEQFWRICDANNAMNVNDLIAEPDRRLRVPTMQFEDSK